MVILFFLFFLFEITHFGLIWSKNLKLSFQVEIWYLDYFEYVNFDGDV